MDDRMMIAAMMAQGILAKPDTGLAPPFPKTDDLCQVAFGYADRLMLKGASPSPASNSPAARVVELVPQVIVAEAMAVYHEYSDGNPEDAARLACEKVIELYQAALAGGGE